MSEFLLLHDNDHDGKPAVIRKGVIASVIESDDYPRSFQDVKPIRTFIKNEK